MQEPGAGRPDLLRPTQPHVMTPEELAAEVARLCPPKPETVYEVCPCCGNGTGAYWVFPSWWTALEVPPGAAAANDTRPHDSNP